MLSFKTVLGIAYLASLIALIVAAFFFAKPQILVGTIVVLVLGAIFYGIDKSCG